MMEWLHQMEKIHSLLIRHLLISSVRVLAQKMAAELRKSGPMTYEDLALALIVLNEFTASCY